MHSVLSSKVFYLDCFKKVFGTDAIFRSLITSVILMFKISTLACVVRAKLNHLMSTTASFEFCSTALIVVSIRKINLTS